MAPFPGESLPGDVCPCTKSRAAGWQRRALGLRITLDSSDKWYKIIQKLGHCLSLAAPIVTYYEYIPLFPLLCWHVDGFPGKSQPKLPFTYDLHAYEGFRRNVYGEPAHNRRLPLDLSSAFYARQSHLFWLLALSCPCFPLFSHQFRIFFLTDRQTGSRRNAKPMRAVALGSRNHRSEMCDMRYLLCKYWQAANSQASRLPRPFPLPNRIIPGLQRPANCNVTTNCKRCA